MLPPVKKCRAWRSCPLCLAGDDGPWHSYWRYSMSAIAEVLEGVDVPISKPLAGVTGPSDLVGRIGGVLADGAPTVKEYLSDEKYADGSARRTSTVTIFVDAGTLKLCLSDRDTGRTLWSSGDSIEEALLQLEIRLTSGDADWRASTGARSGRGKRG